MTLTLPRELAGLTPEQAEDLACRSHLGVWTERKRRLAMAPLHWEWCDIAMTRQRGGVGAPREHSKSETFTVNATAWRSEQTPGLWTYVFCQTGDQAKEMLARTVLALEQTAPWMVNRARRVSSNEAVFANGARITTAGAGKSVRGAHPDIVVGDDVLEEGSCLTELQRKRVERWWLGTVAGMTHPGTTRAIRVAGSSAATVMKFPATRVFLVGTPFHELDLLMAMRTNPLYRFRRYAAEFRPEELVPGTLAVEVR